VMAAAVMAAVVTAAVGLVSEAVSAT